MRVDAGTEALRRVTAGMGRCVAQTTRSAAIINFCAADGSDTEEGGMGEDAREGRRRGSSAMSCREGDGGEVGEGGGEIGGGTL